MSILSLKRKTAWVSWLRLHVPQLDTLNCRNGTCYRKDLGPNCATHPVGALGCSYWPCRSGTSCWRLTSVCTVSGGSGGPWLWAVLVIANETPEQASIRAACSECLYLITRIHCCSLEMARGRQQNKKCEVACAASVPFTFLGWGRLLHPPPYLCPAAYGPLLCRTLSSVPPSLSFK